MVTDEGVSDWAQQLLQQHPAFRMSFQQLVQNGCDADELLRLLHGISETRERSPWPSERQLRVTLRGLKVGLLSLKSLKNGERPSGVLPPHVVPEPLCRELEEIIARLSARVPAAKHQRRERLNIAMARIILHVEDHAKNGKLSDPQLGRLIGITIGHRPGNTMDMRKWRAGHKALLDTLRSQARGEAHEGPR